MSDQILCYKIWEARGYLSRQKVGARSMCHKPRVSAWTVRGASAAWMSGSESRWTVNEQDDSQVTGHPDVGSHQKPRAWLRTHRKAPAQSRLRPRHDLKFKVASQGPKGTEAYPCSKETWLIADSGLLTVVWVRSQPQKTLPSPPGTSRWIGQQTVRPDIGRKKKPTFCDSWNSLWWNPPIAKH